MATPLTIAKIVLAYLSRQELSETLTCFIQESRKFSTTDNLSKPVLKTFIQDAELLPSLEVILADYFEIKENLNLSEDKTYLLWKQLDIILSQLRTKSLGGEKAKTFIQRRISRGGNRFRYANKNAVSTNGGKKNDQATQTDTEFDASGNIYINSDGLVLGSALEGTCNDMQQVQFHVDQVPYQIINQEAPPGTYHEVHSSSSSILTPTKQSLKQENIIETTRSPKRKSTCPKRRLNTKIDFSTLIKIPENFTPDKSVADPTVYETSMSPLLGNDDFSMMLKAMFSNSTFQETIADNINKVTSGEVNSQPVTVDKEPDQQKGLDVEEVVKMTTDEIDVSELFAMLGDLNHDNEDQKKQFFPGTSFQCTTTEYRDTTLSVANGTSSPKPITLPSNDVSPPSSLACDIREGINSDVNLNKNNSDSTTLSVQTTSTSKPSNRLQGSSTNNNLPTEHSPTILTSQPQQDTYNIATSTLTKSSDDSNHLYTNFINIPSSYATTVTTGQNQNSTENVTTSNQSNKLHENLHNRNQLAKIQNAVESLPNQTSTSLKTCVRNLNDELSPSKNSSVYQEQVHFSVNTHGDDSNRQQGFQYKHNSNLTDITQSISVDKSRTSEASSSQQIDTFCWGGKLQNNDPSTLQASKILTPDQQNLIELGSNGTKETSQQNSVQLQLFQEKQQVVSEMQDSEKQSQPTIRDVVFESKESNLGLEQESPKCADLTTPIDFFNGDLSAKPPMIPYIQSKKEEENPYSNKQETPLKDSESIATDALLLLSTSPAKIEENNAASQFSFMKFLSEPLSLTANTNRIDSVNHVLFPSKSITLSPCKALVDNGKLVLNGLPQSVLFSPVKQPGSSITTLVQKPFFEKPHANLKDSLQTILPKPVTARPQQVLQTINFNSVHPGYKDNMNSNMFNQLGLTSSNAKQKQSERQRRHREKKKRKEFYIRNLKFGVDTVTSSLLSSLSASTSSSVFTSSAAPSTPLVTTSLLPTNIGSTNSNYLQKLVGEQCDFGSPVSLLAMKFGAFQSNNNNNITLPPTSIASLLSIPPTFLAPITPTITTQSQSVITQLPQLTATSFPTSSNSNITLSYSDRNLNKYTHVYIQNGKPEDKKSKLTTTKNCTSKGSSKPSKKKPNKIACPSKKLDSKSRQKNLCSNEEIDLTSVENFPFVGESPNGKNNDSYKSECSTVSNGHAKARKSLGKENPERSCLKQPLSKKKSNSTDADKRKTTKTKMKVKFSFPFKSPDKKKQTTVDVQLNGAKLTIPVKKIDVSSSKKSPRIVPFKKMSTESQKEACEIATSSTCWVVPHKKLQKRQSPRKSNDGKNKGDGAFVVDVLSTSPEKENDDSEDGFNSSMTAEANRCIVNVDRPLVSVKREHNNATTGQPLNSGNMDNEYNDKGMCASQAAIDLNCRNEDNKFESNDEHIDVFKPVSNSNINSDDVDDPLNTSTLSNDGDVLEQEEDLVTVKAVTFLGEYDETTTDAFDRLQKIVRAMSEEVPIEIVTNCENDAKTSTRENGHQNRKARDENKDVEKRNNTNFKDDNEIETRDEEVKIPSEVMGEVHSTVSKISNSQTLPQNIRSFLDDENSTDKTSLSSVLSVDDNTTSDSSDMSVISQVPSHERNYTSNESIVRNETCVGKKRKLDGDKHKDDAKRKRKRSRSNLDKLAMIDMDDLLSKIHTQNTEDG